MLSWKTKEYVSGKDFHQNRYAAVLERVVHRGDRWLDLGAGTQIHGGWIGASQEELANRAGFLCGCDLVKDHLARNPHLAGRSLARGEDLPFATESLDVVTANMVVEHLADPAIVFREVCRVLRPKGRFVFVTPNRTHPIVLAASLILHPVSRRLLAHLIERREMQHVFVTYYRANTLAAVRRTAEAAGLQVESIELFSSFPFFMHSRIAHPLEGAVIRLARRERFAFLRSNLVVCLRRK
jgi:ubiquinone/menaquinone biosynthesis C-methylase UbiE